MVIGALSVVASSLPEPARGVIKVAGSQTEGALLEQFAMGRVDWIVWDGPPSVEVAVKCAGICADRPVAASCILGGGSKHQLELVAAGWCVREACGPAGSNNDYSLLGVRQIWLQAWVSLITHEACRGERPLALPRHVLTGALSAAASRETADVSEVRGRTVRRRLSDAGFEPPRRFLMVASSFVAWEHARLASESLEAISLRLQYAKLSGLNRMLLRIVGVTAGQLVNLPEHDLATRLAFAVRRQEAIQEHERVAKKG